jgi:hypothetical protein
VCYDGRSEIHVELNSRVELLANDLAIALLFRRDKARARAKLSDNVVYRLLSGG